MVVEGLGQSEQQRGPECMHTTNQVKRKGRARQRAMQIKSSTLWQ